MQFHLFDRICDLNINHFFPNHFPELFLRADFDTLNKYINKFSAKSMQHAFMCISPLKFTVQFVHVLDSLSEVSFTDKHKTSPKRDFTM